MSKINKINNLLEFIAKIEFQDLPDEVKKVISDNSVLKDYTKVLKSSHYYRLVYDVDKNISDETLKNASKILNMPTTIEKSKSQQMLLIQYKEK